MPSAYVIESGIYPGDTQRGHGLIDSILLVEWRVMLVAGRKSNYKIEFMTQELPRDKWNSTVVAIVGTPSTKRD